MSSKCNNFLPALYRMCNNDAADHRNCITWAPDGGSFWVANIEMFARDILPIYYKHNNYASFVRQLNMYGFHRSTEPKGKVEPGVQMVEHFTQQFFRRGQEELLKNIHRKTSKMAGKTKVVRSKEVVGSSDDRREWAEREQQMTLMATDIEILKTNQMQLAQTVQGLHQALVTLQEHSTEQSEALCKLQSGLGMPAKSEVVPVDPYAQLQFGLLNRRRSDVGIPPQQQVAQLGRAPQFGLPLNTFDSCTSQSSLIELARGDRGSDEDIDEMMSDGAEIDGMLGMLGEMQQTGSYFE